MGFNERQSVIGFVLEDDEARRSVLQVFRTGQSWEDDWTIFSQSNSILEVISNENLKFSYIT